MDSTELQSTLKRLCKVMWEANVTNPITYVTQISYLLPLFKDVGGDGRRTKRRPKWQLQEPLRQV
jgi:hypothetical protein